MSVTSPVGSDPGSLLINIYQSSGAGTQFLNTTGNQYFVGPVPYAIPSFGSSSSYNGGMCITYI